MIQWPADIKVYLHREPVDFRKAINGLSVIVQDEMAISPFDPALFVFCNKKRSQLKVLYWDETGFALWQKRLERDKFKWPKRLPEDPVVLDHEQWQWLLRGFDIAQLKPHETLFYRDVR
ncbi:IS66 family insertion sequence element accessory protein TnpB [Gilvimarinus polysaccharolyticus]|uniref:IS66 family insertion sequence element accessory protein TnpB n=1 Tax=Gilvimarinus polysaccharolyticus TaxID=863921 RepID=UPI00067322A7|nr:IS66 family insertion sequence element accessory protein TnpB [Gilvimarinus polysaccharolyticus]